MVLEIKLAINITIGMLGERTVSSPPNDLFELNIVSNMQLEKLYRISYEKKFILVHRSLLRIHAIEKTTTFSGR